MADETKKTLRAVVVLLANGTTERVDLAGKYSDIFVGPSGALDIAVRDVDFVTTGRRGYAPHAWLRFEEVVG